MKRMSRKLRCNWKTRTGAIGGQRQGKYETSCQSTKRIRERKKKKQKQQGKIEKYKEEKRENSGRVCDMNNSHGARHTRKWYHNKRIHKEAPGNPMRAIRDTRWLWRMIDRLICRRTFGTIEWIIHTRVHCDRAGWRTKLHIVVVRWHSMMSRQNII